MKPSPDLRREARPSDRPSHSPSDGGRWFLAVPVALGLAMLFDFQLSGIAPGVDAPFAWAVNEAAERGLAFGTEFVSTYGPYGYLITTTSGGFWTRRALLEFALVIVSAVAVTAYTRRSPPLGMGVRCAFAALLVHALALQEREDRWLTIFLLVLLAILQESGRRSFVALSGAALLAGFCLLVRASLGVACLASLLWASACFGSLGLRVRRLGLVLVASTGAVSSAWFGAGGSLQGLQDYLVTAAELARGYSSAMSLAPRDWWEGVLAFVAWIACIAVWMVLQPTARNRVSCMVLVPLVFFAWKHGMVRQDTHVYLMVAVGYFVLVVLFVDTWEVRRRLGSLLGAAVCAVPLLCTPLGYAGIPQALREEWRLLSAPLELPGVSALRRLRAVARDGVGPEPTSALLLPASIRERIGGASVDVYPWDVSYVPANGLAWHNRPVPASFSSFTPALDRRNQRFLESSDRPEFVLWHAGVKSIDGRHLFWDEPLTLRSLLGGYELEWAEALGASLLRARQEPLFPAPEVLESVTTPWDRWLPVPDTQGILLAAVHIERSVVARLLRIVFREFPVFLSLRLVSGETLSFRFLPDQAASGLWVNPFPATGQDLLSLLRGGPARRAVAIRFDSGSGLALSPRLDVTWLRIVPYGGGREPPRPERLTLASGRPCAGMISALRSGRDWFGRRAVHAVGWARDGELALEGRDLWLVDPAGRALPTDVFTGMDRPDIARALNAPALATSGWWAIAWVEDPPESIGFVVRGRNGEWVESCNRASAR